MDLVLLPEKNKTQFDELQMAKQNLDVKFVSEYYETFCSLFPETASITGLSGSFNEVALQVRDRVL